MYGSHSAMVQAVSCRSPTAEARVRARDRACLIFGGQSDTKISVSQSSSVLPCRYHSTVTPHTRIGLSSGG
jgi:hypothetical protein